MRTATLIEQLAGGCEPISRLSPPLTRTATWLALAAPYVALVVAVMLPRSDLLAKLSDSAYDIEQFASFATGITAATAAFASIVPGFDRRILLLPIPFFATWFGSIGVGCAESWLSYGPDGLTIVPDWFCFPAIMLVGVVPAIAMALMLRRGAPLTPHLTTALGGLAAAGLGNFGLRLFHQQDASAMLLVWQMGTVFVLTALAGSAGRLLLNWRVVTANARRRILWASHSRREM